jgi:AraC-like DNA-binding protein
VQPAGDSAQADGVAAKKIPIILTEALMHLSKGGSFTEAAHHAGFSDSAHLSRTYRKMYGNSLYNLVRKSQFVQAIPCFV